MAKVVYKIKGMHCASCSVLINKTLARMKGVVSANANYGSEKLLLEYNPSEIALEKIHEIVDKLGYTLILPKEGVTEEEASEQARLKEIADLKKRTIVSFVIAAPIIVYYMAVHMFNLEHIHAFCWGGGGLLSGLADGCAAGTLIDFNWIFLILTAPIQFGIGWPFYRNTWTALRAGSASMAVLVVLGTSAAFFFS